MKYLVTGGAGFIGSHLIERLLKDRHDVVVLDDFSTGLRENIAPFLKQIRLIEGSVTDTATCKKAVEGVDFVLHQAALGSVPRSIADPHTTHLVNATGTLNLLWASRDASVKRFVYAGSSSAYGDTVELPKHEGMPPRPRSPYAVSKLTSEQYCSAFYLTYGLETITLRYFNIFGPRQDPKSQYAAVIPKFIASAFKNERPTIFGDGEQTRDFTYIANCVGANLHACVAPKTAVGGVYNIGAGAQTSLNSLWREIRSVTGATTDPIYEPKRAGDVKDSLASLERTRGILGFDPAVTFAEGIRLTVSSYKR